MTTVQAGDAVQITDPYHHWYPAIVTVTEPKEWGIKGYVVIPTNWPEANRRACILLTLGEYEYVGKAALMAA